VILLAPYAPHIGSELWEKLHQAFPGAPEAGLLLDAPFPQWKEQYLVESVKEYPVSINGKLRTTIPLELSLGKDEVESIVLQNGVVQKWLEGRPPKKIIFVAGKMINVVV
jgi:leucyl-tRNA synthetase